MQRQLLYALPIEDIDSSERRPNPLAAGGERQGDSLAAASGSGHSDPPTVVGERQGDFPIAAGGIGTKWCQHLLPGLRQRQLLRGLHRYLRLQRWYLGLWSLLHRPLQLLPPSRTTSSTLQTTSSFRLRRSRRLQPQASWQGKCHVHNDEVQVIFLQMPLSTLTVTTGYVDTSMNFMPSDRTTVSDRPAMRGRLAN